MKGYHTMRYTVRSGDCLWGLAVQYQGSGTRFPEIVDHHNNEVARYGMNSGLLPITDPNLIFIGQTIFLLPRPYEIKRGNGDKFAANQTATPVDLKVQFTIGKDTEPLVWSHVTLDYETNAELTGDITMEMLSDSKHHHHLEIALSRDTQEVKAKLKDVYGPALSQLIAEPSIKFQDGKAILNSPIDPKLKASADGYTVELTSSGPYHLSGTATPPIINGTVKSDGREYKYTADIKFKVDIHKNPRLEPFGEAAAENQKEKEAEYISISNTDWQRLTAKSANGIGQSILVLIIFSIITWPVRGIRAFQFQKGFMPQFMLPIDDRYRDIQA